MSASNLQARAWEEPEEPNTHQNTAQICNTIGWVKHPDLADLKTLGEGVGGVATLEEWLLQNIYIVQAC